MIRRATTEDADAVGRIFVAARDLMPYLPRIPDEDRPRLGGWILEGREAWVAEAEDRIDGFATLRQDMLDHLYVHPNMDGRGIGTQLLEWAAARRPDGLRLWVFQKNEGARRFYERHGFQLVRLTDGAGNMEHEPDALYEWRR
jgi:GNAT superfamily N-acetyltransferase